jgi:hypothetical protein
MTLEELDRLNDIDIMEVERRNLVDIQTVRIDPSLPLLERIESYLAQIKNPYLFLCDDMIVKVCFKEDGKDLKSSLKNYFINTKKD